MQGHDKQKQDGEILEEFQRGYLLGGKVLRHSKVIVSKKGGEEECLVELE